MTPIAVEKGAKELRKEEDISWTGAGGRAAGDVTFDVLPHLHHLMPVLGTADCAGQEFGEGKRLEGEPEPLLYAYPPCLNLFNLAVSG